ncbi:protein disulfide-isomerase tmx3a-like isoform X2 [Festucalex cinctus]
MNRRELLAEARHDDEVKDKQAGRAEFEAKSESRRRTANATNGQLVHTSDSNALLLSVAPLWAFVDELDDSLLENRGLDDVWLIKFYAPWCRICKQLDPTWHRIGSELKSAGSPVNVGKCDAAANAGLAREFKVRAYPAIFMWKEDRKYLHVGPRTADAIIEFADRVSGPLIRPLSSAKLFRHALSRHHVVFAYIGASSPLKGEYASVAQEMIATTSFFSAGRDDLPEAAALGALPAVAVFKDGACLSYDEAKDGPLKAWIQRERFANFARVDDYLLYAMGDSGKLILLALLDDVGSSQENLSYKNLVWKVSQDYKDVYSRNVHFGFMEGDRYINGLVMGELRLRLPAVVMLNLSSDSYFLPPAPLETERHLLDFVDQVLDGSIQARGGNGPTQRARRLLYDAKVWLSLWREAPLPACLLSAFAAALLGWLSSLCRKVGSDGDRRRDDGDGDGDGGGDGDVLSRRRTADKKSD